MRLKLIISYLIVLAFLAGAGWWAAENWSGLRNALSLSPIHLVALVPLIIVSVLLIGMANEVLASHLGASLRFREWSALAAASTFANYILPFRAGLAVRGGYYKRNWNLPLTSFASCMTAVSVVTALVNALVVMAALAWLWWARHISSTPLCVTAGIVAVLAIAMLAWSPRAEIWRARTGWFFEMISRVHTGWDDIRHSPKVLAQSFAVALAATILAAMRLYVAFEAVGHSVAFAPCLAIGAIASLATFIGITPAALGVREAAIVFSGAATGVAPEVALLAGTFDRIAAMAVVAIWGPFAMARLSKTEGKKT